MLIANELKNGQEIKHTDGRVFTIVSNIPNDVVHLCNLEAKWYSGFHLFYDDLEDVIFAKDTFNIDLK